MLAALRQDAELPQRFGEQPDVKRPKALPMEHRVHRLRKGNLGERPAHDQPVKAPQHSRDLLGITLQKADTRFHACTLLLLQPLGTGYAGLGD